MKTRQFVKTGSGQAQDKLTKPCFRNRLRTDLALSTGSHPTIETSRSSQSIVAGKCAPSTNASSMRLISANGRDVNLTSLAISPASSLSRRWMAPSSSWNVSRACRVTRASTRNGSPQSGGLVATATASSASLSVSRQLRRWMSRLAVSLIESKRSCSCSARVKSGAAATAGSRTHRNTQFTLSLEITQQPWEVGQTAREERAESDVRCCGRRLGGLRGCDEL